MARRSWVWLVLLLGACAPVEPALEVGTGVDAFEPLSDGDDIPMIEGAQGGWHLWVSVRARGIDPSGVELEVVRAPVERQRPRQTTFYVLDLEPAGGWYEVTGLAAVLSQPECFQDVEVSVRASAVDRSGRALSDERVVVPRWPEPIGECAR